MASPRGSLSRRVFVALFVGETVFALVLAVTIGGFSAFSLAHQREQSTRALSATITATLMPVVAQHDLPRVRSQLVSVMSAAGPKDVTGVVITDSSGTEIARAGTIPDPSAAGGGVGLASPLQLLTAAQVISQPVVVDGLTVATVRVAFSSPGLSALSLPAIATVIVLAAVMLVSVPWTAWGFTREVVEPLGDLKSYASRIAQGELDASFDGDAPGEIGDLQETLAVMGRQLKSRDVALSQAMSDLSDAYLAEERSKREIEVLSAVKSNFVAVAAHEIRSPIAIISLYNELLLEGEGDRLGETGLEATSAIASATSRLTSIVSDLMDSALLERGLLPIHFGDVDVHQLLVEAVRDAVPLGRTRGIEVSLGEDAGGLVIPGDPLRLSQVLSNLLSNAIKYSPEGSRVRVSAHETPGQVSIEVTDQGRGIPSESGGQLFALFGRVDFGDSRDTAGLGLGLAITARIVAAHGGSISHRPNPEGRGSIFSVRLPTERSDGARDSVTIRVAEAGDAQ